MGLGGAVRDIVSGLVSSGRLGLALSTPATAYEAVYLFEIVLLFATLIVIGPLARRGVEDTSSRPAKFGLAGLPT
jgi:BCD family chlorophyll transporter-like MFS transporter